MPIGRLITNQESRKPKAMAYHVCRGVEQNKPVMHSQRGRSLPAPTSDLGEIPASQLMPKVMRNHATAT